MRPTISGIQPRRRRGCLSGCFTQVVAALTLGVLVVLAVYGLIAPWGFYLGTGTFHIDPEYRGWGRMHSNALGDFALYVRFGPSLRSGSRFYPSSDLRGFAWLCTPRGEEFRMHLSGSMRAHLNLNTDGEKIRLGTYYWPALTGGFTGDHRPSLSFRGQWQNPDIVLTDNSSLANAFQTDGNVYRGHDPNRRPPHEDVALTIRPGTYEDFKSACTTLTPLR